MAQLDEKYSHSEVLCHRTFIKKIKKKKKKKKKLKTPLPDEGVTYTIQYTLRSMDELDTYQKMFAPDLQKKTNERYEGKFHAFRNSTGNSRLIFNGEYKKLYKRKTCPRRFRKLFR